MWSPLVILPLLAVGPSLQGQVIAGRVVDGDWGRPLPGPLRIEFTEEGRRTAYAFLLADHLDLDDVQQITGIEVLDDEPLSDGNDA